MFDAILSDTELSGLVRLCCQENGMQVDFHPSLIHDSMPDSSKVLILKIDSYYTTKRFATPPPSIDCLIITKCDDGKYSFYLVELRDVNGTSLVKPRLMVPKFYTVINDFFNTKFPSIFMNDSHDLKDVKMWVVTDALGTKSLNETDYRNKIKGTVIEQYLSIKPFKVKNKYVQLEVVSPRLTSPVPIIENC